MSDVHEGGCVCRSLRFRAIGEPARVTVCHCTWCQRRTGSAFAVNSVFPSARLSFSGHDPKVYRHRSDESGRWLDVHFCPTCGASIGFTLEWVPDVFAVSTGTFDDPSWVRPSQHDFRYIYMSSAQSWSIPPEGAVRFEKHFAEGAIGGAVSDR